MEVISLEEGKIEFKDGVVFKKSSMFEYQNLNRAYDLSLKLNDIIVPKPYCFDGEKICMERCYGDNLELMCLTHKHTVWVLNTLII